MVPLESLCVMPVKNIHREKRAVKGGVATLCELCYLPEWLKKSTRLPQNAPLIGGEIIILKVLIMLSLVPLHVLLEVKGNV